MSASVPRTLTATPTRTGPSSTMTRKNAGPLTTGFDAPSRCFDRTLDTAVFASLDQGGYEFAKDLSMFVTDYRSARSICPSASFVPCLPNYSRYRTMQGRGIFFSPGLECPTSWQTMASVTASNTTDRFLFVNGIVVSTLLPGESAYVCCPIGFEYIVKMPPSPPIVYCTSAISRFDSRHRRWSCSGNSTLVEMTETDPGYAITLTSTLGGTTSQVPVSFTTMKLYAPTIQLNRRPHDAAASAAGGTRDGDGRGRASVLRGGAIAGIAVGAVGLLALLSVAAALMWRRRRRRRAAEAAAAAGWRDKPELDGTARGRSELEAGERHELDAGHADQIFELPESGGGGGGEAGGAAEAGSEARTKRWSGLRRGRGRAPG